MAVVQDLPGLAGGFHGTTTVLYLVLLPFLDTEAVALEVALVQLVHTYDRLADMRMFSVVCLFIYAAVYLGIVTLREK